MFRLAGFGDEISSELTTQLEVMKSLRIEYLDLRSVKGKNVLELNNQEVKETGRILADKGFRVSAIASPIGKMKVTDDFSFDLKRLDKAISLACLFEAKYIRIFSYYLPEEGQHSYAEEVLRRIETMTKIAKKKKLVLILENEDDVYGDTPQRCLEILEKIDSSSLRAAFDPANFIMAGIKPYREAFAKMVEYIEYLHIKDARLSDRTVVVAGTGDGEIKEILKELKQRNFDGFLSLEPHLAIAGKMSGFSGKELFEKAARSLQRILREI